MTSREPAVMLGSARVPRPTGAPSRTAGGARQLNHPLAPWTGFALLCGYAAVIIGFAAWRLHRTDA